MPLAFLREHLPVLVPGGLGSLSLIAQAAHGSPGVVTVGELLQEFGAAVRRYGK